jgi:hypothetical protein
MVLAMVKRLWCVRKEVAGVDNKVPWTLVILVEWSRLLAFESEGYFGVDSLSSGRG